MPANTESEAIDLAVGQLVMRHFIQVGERAVDVALLVRYKDVRPLRAPWWTGKDCSIMAVDTNGNFFLRTSDGAVIYRDHATDSEISVSASVGAFLEMLN